MLRASEAITPGSGTSCKTRIVCKRTRTRTTKPCQGTSCTKLRSVRNTWIAYRASRAARLPLLLVIVELTRLNISAQSVQFQV